MIPGDPNEDGNPQVIEPGESCPEDGEPEALDYEKPDDEEAEIAYLGKPRSFVYMRQGFG